MTTTDWLIPTSVFLTLPIVSHSLGWLSGGIFLWILSLICIMLIVNEGEQ